MENQEYYFGCVNFKMLFKKPVDKYPAGCWVFVAMRGLFSSCGERGLLFVVVRRLLIEVASLVAEHGL